MTPKDFLSILQQAGILKLTKRHCFTMSDRWESVAEHSWRISLMAMLLSGEEEFQDLDMNKVIRMCLIHDLGESFTGDIPTFMKSNTDSDTEDDLFMDWVRSFPEPQQSEWSALLEEMGKLETGEAKLYKALDKMEALISHNESDISTWLPLEYDLQLTYGQKEMSEFQTLKSIRSSIDDWTKRKIEASSEAAND
ncbi:MAG: HD domain-containing protein [Oscillospiraceae bacterium]|nr:HD domain-containing protein [Oscillospiraceae bacterium]